ncbi:hypothetical protein Hypma_016394 [Hypsizygus marmoreus]|uniref:BTB domain-containing protein n=1 Tax=Hypsizygus marmoreus TaxID=39966 RepID=A0A369J0J7_HYPMA|nr:hypothetical protein Hypma_016394 [Hypsizygus marmoreus]
MDSQGSPSRKRQRVDTEPEVPPPAEPPVQDPVYYKNDGDCVILVKNTLFKIHRFLLTRDSTVFADMFSLPGNESSPQGTADSTPILLHDDPEDFRYLCWALYALPTELSAQSTAGGANVSKLIRLAKLVNKYQFASFEKWAIGIVTQQCVEHKYLTTCHHSQFSSLLGLASLCNHEPLRQAVQDTWLVRLQNTATPYASALNAATEYGHRDFQGMVYYILLQTLDKAEATPIPKTSALVNPAPKLSAAYNQILRTGYWSLSKYWERCCKGPPVTLPRSKKCVKDDHTNCLAGWEHVWRATIRNNKLDSKRVDVLESLDRLQKSFPKSRLIHSNIMPECAELAVQVVPSLQEELRRTMADHFLGPL